MYGNCDVCGKRFGTTGDGIWHEPCDHMVKKASPNLPKAEAYSLLAELQAIAEEMVYPIQYLENEAKKRGSILNGGMAVQISNDVEFYKSRSRIILQKISEHFS